jgi:hypothetical protein
LTRAFALASIVAIPAVGGCAPAKPASRWRPVRLPVGGWAAGQRART